MVEAARAEAKDMIEKDSSLNDYPFSDKNSPAANPKRFILSEKTKMVKFLCERF